MPLRLSVLAPLSLLAILCLLPLCSSFLGSGDSAGSSALVAAAAPARRATAGSYVSDNSDLEEDEEDADDEEEEQAPSARRRAQQATAQQQQRRKAAAASTSDEDESLDSSSSDAPLQLRLSLSHSFSSSGPFLPRGDVLLNFNPARGSKAILFSPEQRGSKSLLREAATNDALYRVRFAQEGQKEEDAIMAAVPACALAASHFLETFVFNVDPYGSLLSVSYRTPVAECASSEVAAALGASSKSDSFLFTPKAKISFGKPGEKAKLHVRPGFDASSQANAQAVGAEPTTAAASGESSPAAAHEKGPDGKPLPPPQSFWQKYWMYIVPVGIFVLLQAVMAPPEQAAAGAASGGARAQ